MRISYFCQLTTLCLVMLCSCGKKTDSESATSQSGISGNAVGGLSVEISTAWENTPSEFEVHKTCSATGTALAPELVDCDVPIGELQLHLSKLKISVDRTVGDCAVLNFIPYRFQLSNGAAYVPVGGGAAIDCSPTSRKDVPLDCWGGVAKDVVPSFPEFSYIFTTAAHFESIMDSPNEKLDSTNRYVSNDLVDRLTSQANYLGVDAQNPAGSMVDYTVSCEDIWANPLSYITIHVIDFDGANPTTDHIPSWN